MRKQRELALHVLTGGIKGWEGEELSTLGEIFHVGPVTLVVGAERRDRYFVLFPMNLLVLSTSARMSSFVYEVNFISIVDAFYCKTKLSIFSESSFLRYEKSAFKIRNCVSIHDFYVGLIFSFKNKLYARVKKTPLLSLSQKLSVLRNKKV